MAEVILNGVLEEEVTKYYHICFFTDDKGHDPDNEDNYIFIPKAVCRVVDDYTVSILDWYVAKKKLYKFMRGSRRPMLKRIQTQSQARPSSSTVMWNKKKPLGTFKP